MYHTLGIVLVCLGSSWARDTSKAFRSMPTISNSLVNLGKMDITFNFNSKSSDGQFSGMKPESFMHQLTPFLLPQKSEPIELEPCPCSSIKNFKNPFLSNPSDILNKILKSNDLFSFNQDQSTSTMCCDSHEQIQEDTVFFEFNPKPHVETAPFPNPLPTFPIIMDSFAPKAPLMNPTNNKLKAIEIFFFPKKKDGSMSFDFPKSQSKKKDNPKKDITIVGDKELRNDFKNMRFRPTFPILPRKEELEMKLFRKDDLNLPARKEELEMKLFKKEDLTLKEDKKSIDKDKMVKPDKYDKADKYEKAEKYEKAAKAMKQEKNEKLEKKEKLNENDHADKVAPIEKVDEKKGNGQSVPVTELEPETTRNPGALNSL